MNKGVTFGMMRLCHVALERETLGKMVEAKCQATLMHEHGSGWNRGMENTWPSNGHVSNQFGSGVLHLNQTVWWVRRRRKSVRRGEKRGRKERKKERKKRRKEERKK